MPLSTLCLRCGLCCDGTLFTHVPLKPAEAGVLRQRGIRVGERADGVPVLAQSCTVLEGRCCTVYAERPEGCRRYRCNLFAALAEKELSLEEALAVVEQAHARVAAVEAALPASAEKPPPAVMQRARQADQPDNGGPLPPEARAAWEQANDFLDCHFRGRHRRYSAL